MRVENASLPEVKLFSTLLSDRQDSVWAMHHIKKSRFIPLSETSQHNMEKGGATPNRREASLSEARSGPAKEKKRKEKNESRKKTGKTKLTPRRVVQRVL